MKDITPTEGYYFICDICNQRIRIEYSYTISNHCRICMERKQVQWEKLNPNKAVKWKAHLKKVFSKQNQSQIPL